MKCIIYKATNVKDGYRSYIGFTTQSLTERRNEHLRKMRNGSDYYFHNAIRKYGADAFEWQELYSSNDADHTLNVIECQLIQEHHSHYSQHGYNMTWGGDTVMTGRKHSEETRKLISERVKASHNPIRAERMADAKRGKPGNATGSKHPHTEEAKLNISKNHHFAKNGRPGHGTHLKNYFATHPEKTHKGKTWKVDPVTGKRTYSNPQNEVL